MPHSMHGGTAPVQSFTFHSVRAQRSSFGMLKQQHTAASLAAALRLFCGVPLSRSFAAPPPLVSTLTVPQALHGLRADRVMLALLQVRSCMPRSASNHLFAFAQACQWSAIQRALGASCVRIRDGENPGAGRRVSADERVSGEALVACVVLGRLTPL